MVHWAYEKKKKKGSIRALLKVLSGHHQGDVCRVYKYVYVSVFGYIRFQHLSSTLGCSELRSGGIVQGLRAQELQRLEVGALVRICSFLNWGEGAKGLSVAELMSRALSIQGAGVPGPWLILKLEVRLMPSRVQHSELMAVSSHVNHRYMGLGPNRVYSSRFSDLGKFNRRLQYCWGAWCL